ncbi:Ribonuclease H domain [Sesbania bispinosa]|nr:Ribonuclease H domain [Sesbania bispinosa]
MTDSTLALKLILEDMSPYHQYAATISNIKSLLSKDWSVTILHTFREGNQSADCLAKRGVHAESAFEVLHLPPAELKDLLLADARGMEFSRP